MRDKGRRGEKKDAIDKFGEETMKTATTTTINNNKAKQKTKKRRKEKKHRGRGRRRKIRKWQQLVE